MYNVDCILSICLMNVSRYKEGVGYAHSVGCSSKLCVYYAWLTVFLVIALVNMMFYFVSAVTLDSFYR